MTPLKTTAWEANPMPARKWTLRTELSYSREKLSKCARANRLNKRFFCTLLSNKIDGLTVCDRAQVDQAQDRRQTPRK